MTDLEKKNADFEAQTEEARGILMEELRRLAEGAKLVGNPETLAGAKLHADIAQSMAKVADSVARCRSFFPLTGFVPEEEPEEDE